eukprot:gene2789-3400_t
MFALLQLGLLLKCAHALSKYAYSPPPIDNGVTTNVNFDVLALTGRGRFSLLGGFSASGASVVLWYSEFYKGNVVWSQQAVLRPPSSPSAATNFGSAVDLDGQRVLVGEEFNSEKGITGAGAAYFFSGDFTAWTQQQKVFASDPHTTANFGAAVGISGNRAIIGAPGDDDKAQGAGSAYTFNYITAYVPARRLIDAPVDPKSAPKTDTKKDAPTPPVVKKEIDAKSKPVPLVAIQYWSQQQKLSARTPLQAGRFGYTIKVKEDIAIIGAPQTPQTTGFGNVYVFASNDQSLWSQQQVISGLVGNIGEYFDLYGRVLVIGNTQAGPLVGSLALPAGAIYVYKSLGTSGSKKYTFTSVTTLVPSVSTDNFYGNGVAIYGPTIFGSTASSAGNVYVTTLVGTSFSQQQILTDPFGAALYPTVRSAYGSMVTISDGQGPEAFFFSAQTNWSCLILSLGDQFGDGWDTAKLTVVAPDGSSDQYAPSCRTNNPYQLRYCPNLATDGGVYTVSVPNAPQADYFWEIYWTAQIENTWTSYRGDHGTSLKFFFNSSSLAFQFVSGVHIQNNGTCNVCKPKPLPPKPKVAPIVPQPPQLPPVPPLLRPVGGKRRLMQSDPPTAAPTVAPTATPTAEPTAAPSASPSVSPTAQPSAAPTVEPTLSPTGPTSPAPSVEPTIAPSHVPTLTHAPTSSASNQPTLTPTAWPTLNSSYYVDWHWLTIMDNTVDGWFQADGEGTSYYISTADGSKLVSSGTLCPSTLIYQCWQDLKDGEYVLRVGG